MKFRSPPSLGVRLHELNKSKLSQKLIINKATLQENKSDYNLENLVQDDGDKELFTMIANI